MKITFLLIVSVIAVATYADSPAKLAATYAIVEQSFRREPPTKLTAKPPVSSGVTEKPPTDEELKIAYPFLNSNLTDYTDEERQIKIKNAETEIETAKTQKEAEDANGPARPLGPYGRSRIAPHMREKIIKAHHNKHAKHAQKHQ